MNLREFSVVLAVAALFGVMAVSFLGPVSWPQSPTSLPVYDPNATSSDGIANQLFDAFPITIILIAILLAAAMIGGVYLEDGRAGEGGPLIPLEYELLLSGALLCIGLYGVLARRNAIIVLMSIEIILNASILNFVAFSSYSGNPSGQIFALLGIAVAAAEAAVGLAVFLSIYQTHGSIELDKIRFLKW